jgi:1A family penicillin-binding protein
MSAVAFAWFTKDLPTPSKIASRKASESTKIYDRTGNILLYETGEQKRTIVKEEDISQYLKDATIATEDTKFYQHHGFDSRAIASAVLEKVLGRTSRARGGSTITQQYVKNALLNSNRSLTRKVKELILAIELEVMYSKDDILTMYLNEIPYGNNTAGAEAAARMYYGKTAKDLTLSEAATLAGIPQKPTYYSPYGTHLNDLVNRRNYVLDRMVGTGKISSEEAEKAKQEDTTTIGKSLRPRRDTILAPHFAMYVLEKVAEKYGEEKVQKEGLKIITSLDFDKQKIAEEAINKGTDKITKYGATNAALVAVDPKTGQIVAMVGSRDYFDASIDGNVNVADSLRQPGSSFKPIAYATAFKKKEYSPSKILFDVETDFGGGYKPQNYNGRFNGPVTIRTALSNSLNIPAVKILSLATMDNVLRTADDMGITTLTQRERYGLSLVLGSGEVRPVEMAGAFGVFANGGIKHDLKSVLKVTDSDGKVLYEYKPNKDFGSKVLDPQVAYEISNILSDNNARSMVFGPRSALFFPERPVAVKTGTTSDFKDAWTVGYTPSLSTAVWVGNSNATKMRQGADGSVLAAPIFHTFVEQALKDVKSEEFARPDGIVELEVEKYSNNLATEHSKEKTKDIFASWQVPTEKDSTNVAVKLCLGTDKRAPADFPDNLTETRTVSLVHSERPDNPNWENPVRSWAEANGYGGGSIPSDYCTQKDFVPSISITSPLDGSTVSGDITIGANVSSTFEVSSVEFFIDDISIGSTAALPYAIPYNTKNLSTERTHKVQAVAVDKNGSTSKADITIGIARDQEPPAISQISAVSTNATASISWTTSEETVSQVFYDIIARQALSDYRQTSTRSTSPGKNHSASLSALTPNTRYYYRVVSTDSNGNSTASEERTFVTLP